ncbi:hypothetical protein FQ330_05860 [Agrococcus sediminis]|uniref:Uncharacterized protein n=1 Tax=Agrococcus sediminis TaxID=2599924 RepID=A0A5M8QEU4_9MICO|nr:MULTISPECIES: hypothetical protein [Agrococcus]KAA6433621.1 hypothetical protein FQ330_05860 [Agrococcus sediminis]MDR7234770.1 hypothetical protein [Agrococcus sp. BE272]RWR22021.1 hypothetical protein D8Y24_08445 [Agrococcus lahaulensis]UOW00373.1 hypothetical protein MU522_10615 [Agrococcus sp. SCSIO52902]
MSGTATEHHRVQRQASWSGDEVWHTWRLGWADRSSRSLLLAALAVGGLLACYGLTLLLHRPPAIVPSVTLRGIGVLLLMLAAVVAPASLGYRIGAVFCIVLYAIAQVPIVLMQSTTLLGATTYGAFDAIDFLAGGALIVAWMLVRMRHPLTILIVVLGYATAGAAFFGRALPLLRPRLAADPWAEQVSIADEALVRSVLLALLLGLVLLAWWLDGWMRALLPVANVAEPHGSGRASRTGERPRLRSALILALAGLDLLAIAVAISAKQPVARGRLSEDDDWWASIVLAVSTARAAMVILGIAAAIIWITDPQYRAL